MIDFDFSAVVHLTCRQHVSWHEIICTTPLPWHTNNTQFLFMGTFFLSKEHFWGQYFLYLIRVNGLKLQISHVFIWNRMALRNGSCTSELQLKVNCRPKVNCRIKFGLICKLLAEPAQILSYRPHFTFRLQFTFSCNSIVNDLGLSVGCFLPYMDKYVFLHNVEILDINVSCFLFRVNILYFDSRNWFSLILFPLHH